ncbi:MAG: adenylate/guanylate cyclase domain-containing protein [Geminicoccaceae bacterium]|nr:MAG: adenylate/guanylate cyclase domain-containing protein [Geminicoccaceae bacterium]
MTRALHLDHLPARVQHLIDAREIEGERLISWVQLVLVVVLGSLYLLAPRPADAGMLQPVPLILIPYFAFSLLRLWMCYRRVLPVGFVVLSMVVDVTMLWGLIWSFHLDYGQPAAFYLNAPTFMYVFVLIAIRALRFDPRYVLAMGLFASIGWLGLVAYAVVTGGERVVTRSFVDYLTGNYVLWGGEFDKLFALLAVTLVSSLVVLRARRTLLVAVREEEAGRDLRRFLPGGVAEAVSAAEERIEAGRAEARDAAVLMLDIRGFTRFAHGREPDDLVAMLTSFHRCVVPVIEAHGGTVDKFMGDGVMATFGAVTPSTTAAADALRATEAVMAEAEPWARARGDALEVHAAVTSGPLVFAALGYAERLEYTVIGAPANLAAKLEKHNKVLGSRALTTAADIARAERQGYRPKRPLDLRRGTRVADVEERLDVVVLHGSTLHC